MPPGAHALASIGTETERVVADLLRKDPDQNLFSQDLSRKMGALADALKAGGWQDQLAAKVVSKYLGDIGSREPDIDGLCKWVRAHVNEPENVFECMDVIPPERVSITRVLNRAGSQKVVFLGNWSLTQKLVVLKRFIARCAEADKRVRQRESQAHPLSMAHPNIIETYFMLNAAGEEFLVEEFLPVGLNDLWRCHGIQEAANLLFDIANALHYLHTDLKWVHGDVKPDNIRKRGASYVLLDFGICRPIGEFAGETSATGSLRTRAPELLLQDRYNCPTLVDVWALGATVFNAMTGRFPLFDDEEMPPRVSDPTGRELFEKELRRRVQDEWSQRVVLDKVPDPIRALLGGMLEKDPSKRWTCAQTLEMAKPALAGFLRNQSEVRAISPLEELEQLVRHLPRPGILRLMPTTEKDLLIHRLTTLASLQGVPEERRAKANEIIGELR
jgi:serine/threonine protein kinase